MAPIYRVHFNVTNVPTSLCVTEHCQGNQNYRAKQLKHVEIVAHNGQDLLQGWNSLLVLPGTAAEYKNKSTN
jgi:hypothetical protein